jgi:hypothetical protein
VRSPRAAAPRGRAGTPDAPRVVPEVARPLARAIRYGWRGPDERSPSVRVRRLLKRLLIVVLVLVVLGVAAFSWFLYWPLEGSVALVESLVPAEVDFVYKASWPRIRATGWVQRNFVEHPVHPSTDVAPLVQGIDDVRAELDRVNASIPLGALRMDLERDFLAGDVVAAGRFCGGTQPKEGAPRWREVLLLARVTPRMKVNLSALRQGFVRSRTGPDVSIEPRAGYLRLELKNVLVTDRRSRGCEGGHEAPPENVWYLARVKDVMAVTNSEDLAEKVAALGRGEGQRAVDRPGFRLGETTGGVSAVVDVLPLRSYFNRALAGPDSQGLSAFLGRFLTVDALDRMNATAEPAGPDGLRAFADIRHIPSDLHPQVQEAYRLPPTSFAQGVANLVPAKDTFLVAHLETPPVNLFTALYESLSPSDRRLWEDNLRGIAATAKAEGKPGYGSVREFFDELASKLDTTTGVAFARLSSVYDQVEYATWYPQDDPNPQFAVAIVAGVKPALGATPEERRKNVDEFLADRVALLGFDPPEPAVRDGVPFSRMRFRTQFRDIEHVKPAYLVFEGRLVLASHEDYLFAILDTMRGGASAPVSVAASEEFRAVASPLPEAVTVGLYVNVAEVRKVQWDYRNQWVHRTYPDDRFAIDLRTRLERTAASRGPVSDAEREKIFDEVDREVARYREEQYPVFIEERRRQLEDLKRLRAAAVTLTAGGNEVLRGGAVILFNPPE